MCLEARQEGPRHFKRACTMRIHLAEQQYFERTRGAYKDVGDLVSLSFDPFLWNLRLSPLRTEAVFHFFFF